MPRSWLFQPDWHAKKWTHMMSTARKQENFQALDRVNPPGRGSFSSWATPPGFSTGVKLERGSLPSYESVNTASGQYPSLPITDNHVEGVDDFTSLAGSQNGLM